MIVTNELCNSNACLSTGSPLYNSMSVLCSPSLCCNLTDSTSSTSLSVFFSLLTTSNRLDSLTLHHSLDFQILSTACIVLQLLLYLSAGTSTTGLPHCNSLCSIPVTLTLPVKPLINPLTSYTSNI